MSIRSRLLRLLGDGGTYSSFTLGRSLAISRAAVRKHILTLIEQGIAIDIVRGRGYRLTEPIVPLDKDAVLSSLGEAAQALGDGLEILEGVDSTNNVLLALAADETLTGRVCIAEYSTAARGRRGRGWISQPFKNIMLSMAWVLEKRSTVVVGLSLAAAVAVMRALRQYGLHQMGVKWPNDITWNDRKLAGLLVEINSDVRGRVRVVLGVGINVRIGGEYARLIDQPWVDLETIFGASVNRNVLAACLILELRRMFEHFALSGLSGFQDEWNAAHIHQGREATVYGPDGNIHGTVLGVDEAGALLVRDQHGVTRRFWSGDVSLRVGA